MRILLTLLVIMTIGNSCRQKIEIKDSRFFDPPMDIKTSDLKALGYNYIDNWTWYNKVNGDTAFIYQTHFDSDPVFSRLIDIGNWTVQDSLGLKHFIESKDGTLISPIFKEGPTTIFFVHGKSSGQFFRCSLTSSHLTIQFHYPDINDDIRSKYRKPTLEGFTVEFEKGQDKRSYQTK